MNDQQRVKAEAIGRSVEWLSGAGLLVPSTLNTKFLALQTTHMDILDVAGQVEGKKATSAEEFGGKGGDRETLRNQVSAIHKMAEAMSEDFPDLDLLFPFRRHMSDQDLLATARAYVTNAAGHESDFVDWGLPATFIADLTAAADAFQESIDSASGEFGDRVALNALLNSKISTGMRQKRTIGTMVEQQFSSDVVAITGWRTASRVEQLNGESTPPPTT